jgi:hypothetical protein
MANNSKNALNSITSKFTNVYNILLVVILIGSGIGNYVISDYRHDQHEKEIAKLDARVKKTEEVNYELLIQQLEDIQDANNKLTTKIDETNGRIDKVLEILSNK